MIDVRMKYQASAFIQAQSIIPTPDIIKTLMDLFKDKELIPNTFQEIGLGSPQPQVRLRLSSPSNEWTVNFPSIRVYIEKNPTDPKGVNLGEVDGFCNDATDFIERILSRFKKKANRLSLVTNFLLAEMSDSELSEAYLRLFKPPTFYVETPPFEWNWRTVSKKAFELEGLDETLNVITSVNRVKGEFGTAEERVPFDRLRIGFDINTVPDNEEYRFEKHHLVSFYDHVFDLHKHLLAEMEGYLHG